MPYEMTETYQKYAYVYKNDSQLYYVPGDPFWKLDDALDLVRHHAKPMHVESNVNGHTFTIKEIYPYEGWEPYFNPVTGTEYRDVYNNIIQRQIQFTIITVYRKLGHDYNN